MNVKVSKSPSRHVVFTYLQGEYLVLVCLVAMTVCVVNQEFQRSVNVVVCSSQSMEVYSSYTYVSCVITTTLLYRSSRGN